MYFPRPAFIRRGPRGHPFPPQGLGDNGVPAGRMRRRALRCPGSVAGRQGLGQRNLGGGGEGGGTGLAAPSAHLLC